MEILRIIFPALMVIGALGSLVVNIVSKGEYAMSIQLLKNLKKIFQISDGKSLSATNADAPIIRNAKKQFVKPGNTTNQKINRLCKS